jgi:hypothetical protein
MPLFTLNWVYVNFLGILLAHFHLISRTKHNNEHG